jgi:hypothetical protein
MKRFFFCVAVLVVASSLPALELRLGLSGWEGLTYRGEPAFGWTGSAAQVLLEGPSQWLPAGLRPLGGVELAAGGLGTQVLFPLGITWKTFFEKGWSLNLAAHALSGGTLSKSGTAFTPQALLGGEGEARLEWAWEPGIGVGLTAGLRYTTAPWYAAAPYAVLEVPVRLDLEFALSGSELE